MIADDEATVAGSSDARLGATLGATLGDLSGTVLDDKYRIARKIGAGSMGDVYEAEHIALRRRVAVKVLKPERAHREVFVKRFMREARSASMIDHPGVVEILDYGHVPDGPVYFAMEYLEGEDLGALLKREFRLPWKRCRDILAQIMDALAAAHALGIVHRDIKPANCLLLAGTTGDQVKLLDFGVAKLGVDMVSKELTNAADVIGTVLYMSPEQALGQPAEARTDVYAVGVMAYELATGRVPFPGNDIFKVMSRHLRTPPPPPRQSAPDLPADAEAVILKALAKQPEQRFQSIAQMRQAILATTAPSPLALRAHPSVDPVMSAEILLPDGAPAAWRRPPEGDVSAATRTAGYDVPDSQPNIPELGNFDDAPTAYFSAHPVEATAWIRAPRRLDVDHTLVASEVATPFEVPRVVTEIVVQPLQPSVEPSVPTDWIDEDERFHQSPSLATVVTGIVFTILLAGSGIVLALTY